MRATSLLLIGLALAGCVGTGTDDVGADGQLQPLPPPGKADGQYHAGLRLDADTSRTDVWKVTNQWEDRDTPAAREAGIAWPANSGLSWDEKYRAWIAAFHWIPAADGWGTTYELTTPWGKTLPAPSLECAETALFLRITFASWYGLPLQLEAQDEHGQRIYFGHFGIRTQHGRWTGMPEFAVRYKDDTNTDWRAHWPSDPALRKRTIHGGEDDQSELAEGAVFGAYLDEIYLNKRVGYFTTIVLDYLGSANLADTANTYNLVPETVSPGDLLLERWQRRGIGHTLVVKDVKPVGDASLDVTLVSGSMPRRQGLEATGGDAKEYFTGEYTGGPGMNSDGDLYVKLGGGLKRWRVAKPRNGYWTNTWMEGDEAHWIDSNDDERLAARPARFEQLLGEVPLDQQKAELLARIADARHHLSQYPASCAARTQREQAFQELYDVEQRLEYKSKDEVDAEQRQLEDYVFAELDYSHSQTCCWDSSSSGMYDIIMMEAQADKAAADAQHVCVAPVVFEARADGYQRWADYAASLGRGAEWLSYHDDEHCGVRGDTEATAYATPYCELGEQ